MNLYDDITFIDYSNDYTDTFIEECREMLKNGWLPLGGVVPYTEFWDGELKPESRLMMTFVKLSGIPNCMGTTNDEN